MKGLATALLFVGLTHLTVMAGPLELSIGGGPSVISLDEINESVGIFNALITHLNETFAVHPDVTGAVDLVSPMSGGMYLHAAERYWLTDWFALGGHIGYVDASASTTGFYEGSEISEIGIDLGFHSVGGVVVGEATLVDVGLRLGVFGGVGYYHAILDCRTLFEIPVEYPDVIAGVPPNCEGRFSGGSIGFEAGISLTYPVAPWFMIGSRFSFRSARIAELTDTTARVLDLDGDGTGESISLSGLIVQLTVSINIDLSLDGRKE